jgi:nucleotide-binding universal stress UspA family protein
MSTNILVPLDGSTLAEQALPTAVSLVKQRHGRLELAFVHEPIAVGGFDDTPWNAMSQSMQDLYVTDKAEQLGRACAGHVGHALLRGDIEDEISKRARAVNAAMIVMCSHGRIGLSRVLAGSVADGVIQRSNLPVLLLRPAAPGSPTRVPPLDFRKILIPIDTSPYSRQIFDDAIALAKPGNTEFVLLRVVAPVYYLMDGGLPKGYATGPFDEEATALAVAAAERDVADAAADFAARSGHDVDGQVVVSEHAGMAIVDYARKFDIDLIAMTTHSSRLSRLVLGSVTDAVLRSSSTPMLVLRPSAAN